MIIVRNNQIMVSLLFRTPHVDSYRVKKLFRIKAGNDTLSLVEYSEREVCGSNGGRLLNTGLSYRFETIAFTLPFQIDIGMSRD